MSLFSCELGVCLPVCLGAWFVESLVSVSLVSVSLMFVSLVSVSLMSVSLVRL
jgi:hypothetical protein